MTPEQQAAIDRARTRVKEKAQLVTQLDRLDEADDQKILAPKREAAIARAKARRSAPAPAASVEKEPDSFGDDVLDVAGEFALGGNRSVADVLDLVSSPLRGAANLGAWVAGTEGRMPSFNQLLDRMPGAQEGFMDEGTAKDVVGAAGYTLPIGAAFMPVQRAAGSTSSVVQDILGLGSSELTQSQRMAEITQRAIQDMDAIRLGKDVLSSTDDIYEAAYRLGKKQILEKNRPLLDEAEAIEMNRLKQVEKGGVSDIEPPKGVTKVSLREVQDQMYAIYGVDPKDTLKAIGKNKGLRYDDDLLSLQEADKLFTGGGKGGQVNWYDKTFLPVADVLRRYVDPRVGGMFERAVETATRNTSRIVDNLGKPIEDVIRLVDNNTQLKRLFLDVGRDPKLMGDIQRIIRSEAGEPALREFNKFLAASSSRNGEALKHLFRKDGGFDDVFYFHTQKRSEEGVKKPMVKSPRKNFPEKPDALRVRTRKVAAEMEDAELALYENPLATHLQYMEQQEMFLEIAKKFGLRPSLSKNSSVDDFFREVQNRLSRDGLDEHLAKGAATIMKDVYNGAKRAPNAAVRSFMNLSYAGTLAQLKTAVLNLHDVAVAMFNQGLTPTLRALVQSNNGQFGKTLKQLGMGDNQAVGEFVNNFDKFNTDPSIWDTASKSTKKFSDGAMYVSGFKYLDGIGKGVVLRATLNRARQSARDGTLAKDFGHLMRQDELIKIRPYLKEGTSAKAIPEDAARLIEELAFTGLGEQQLISVAGRPLNYLNHANLRPLYALTGFAIKQQALLRRMVLDEFKKGNFSTAGKNAAAYAAYAGLGYGVIHEGREALAGKEEFESADIWPNAIDQIVAAATLNKLGDDYGRDQFVRDPVGFLMSAFIPPTGLVGAAAQDAASAVEALVMDGEFDSELAKRVPLLGDFYRYYWKDE